MKYFIHLFVFLIAIPLSIYSQCKEGFNYAELINNGKVRIAACIALPSKDNNGFYIGQRVSWTVYNLTGDKLKVKFGAVYYLTCGNTLKIPKETIGILQAYGQVSGSGAIDPYLEDYISKDDCDNATNRLSKVGIENVQVKNISEEERQEAKRKEIEETNRLAKEKLENEKVNTSKAAQTLTQTQLQKKDSQTNSNSQQLEYQKQQNELKKQQLQQMQANYNTKMQAIKDGTDPTMQAVNQVAGTLQNIIQDNLEASRQRRAEELARIEQKRLDEEQIEIKKQLNSLINSQIAGSNDKRSLKLPYSVIENIDTIYYVCWCKKENENSVYIFEPISLKKYTDNTWPSFNDLERKINSKLTSTNIFDVNINIYGYYTDKSIAWQVYNEVKKNTLDQKISVITLTISEKNNLTNNSNFWDN
ncbi:MAG TPA: hypothetical protein PKL37_22665 [Panacibacter sp.]|nr:hypothetical protein [Panacibacter sp.]